MYFATKMIKSHVIKDNNNFSVTIYYLCNKLVRNFILI